MKLPRIERYLIKLINLINRMKITLRDISKGGQVIKTINNPMEVLQDWIVKRAAHALKLIYKDGTIEEFYLESDVHEVVEDLDLDTKELRCTYLVRGTLKWNQNKKKENTWEA